jgi:hypothetical protein
MAKPPDSNSFSLNSIKQLYLNGWTDGPCLVLSGFDFKSSPDFFHCVTPCITLCYSVKQKKSRQARHESFTQSLPGKPLRSLRFKALRSLRENLITRPLMFSDEKHG